MIKYLIGEKCTCFIDIVEIRPRGLGLGIAMLLKLTRFDCVKKTWQVMKSTHDRMAKGYTARV